MVQFLPAHVAAKSSYSQHSSPKLGDGAKLMQQFERFRVFMALYVYNIACSSELNALQGFHQPNNEADRVHEWGPHSRYFACLPQELDGAAKHQVHKIRCISCVCNAFVPIAGVCREKGSVTLLHSEDQDLIVAPAWSRKAS